MLSPPTTTATRRDHLFPPLSPLPRRYSS
ncbi:hypothetical protein V496_09309, partial [Pseudogymnoascus sp. VKM F-4515 (FW-2607)]